MEDPLEENGLNILDLNDDCLQSIVECIGDLSEEIQLAKSCRQFRRAIISMWKRQQHRKALEYDKLKDILGNDKDLRFYLLAMSEDFCSLKIYGDWINDVLKEIKNFGIKSFPRVTKCVSGVHHILNSCVISDGSMEALTKLMPNLKCLYMMAGATGKHLSNFQYLEELHLYQDYKKDEIWEGALSEICLSLKNLRVLDIRTWEESFICMVPEISECHQLEVIKLNMNTIKPMLDEILGLPKLKQLQVRLDISLLAKIDSYNEVTRRIVNILPEILRKRGPEITGIAVDLEYISTVGFNFDYLQPENLKLLALCGLRFEGNVYAKYKYKQLELLSLRNSIFHTNDILKMLTCCPVLKHFDISYGWNLDASLLKNILSYWENERPDEVLNVYYDGSGFEEDITMNNSFWTAQKHLRLLNGMPPGSETGFSYVEQGFAVYFD